MKLNLLRRAFVLFVAAGSPAAWPLDGPAQEQEDTKLPNGKSQRDEILKVERDENIKDAAQLVDLAAGLKADLEKGDRFVLSMATLKKTDDIEKLAKKIRARLHH